jgi:hypothetical protein
MRLAVCLVGEGSPPQSVEALRGFFGRCPHLVERALSRFLLWTPARKFRPVAKTSSGEVVVLHFAD